MSRAPRPEFLAPGTYRGRRLQDAARMLPILGAFLFVLPIVWVAPEVDNGATAFGFMYIFGVWLILILCAALLARRLRRRSLRQSPDDEDGG